jgi:serine protease
MLYSHKSDINIAMRLSRLVFVLSLSLVAFTAFAGEGRYLISTRQPAAKMRLRMVVNSEEVRRHGVRTFENINAFAATLTDEEVAELRQSGEIVSVDPVVARHMSAEVVPSTIASDIQSKYVKQIIPWGLDAIHARDVWPVTRGAKNVNIAILDAGIDDTHPDLKAAIAGEYDVYTQGNKAFDDTAVGHGTHVAGTIAATDNAVGTVGIAPDTRIWAVKVLNGNGDGTDEAVALGLDWVVSKKKEVGGAWIVNFSLGAPHPSAVEEAGVKRALDAGVIVISAAGNRQLASVDYPAGYEGVISVGALTDKNELAGFSSFGIGLLLAAPGVDIPSTVPVGRVKISEVEVDAATTVSYGTNGSPLQTVSGQLVFCGYGKAEDFPANMAGKVAIMNRGGSVYFGEKSRNATLAGAVGVIIVNDDDKVNPEIGDWDLLLKSCSVDGCFVLPEFDGFPFAVTVSVSRKDGDELLKKAGRTVATVSYRGEDYAVLGGTSMAAPHVSGTVALMLALDPTLTPSQVEFALIASTLDLGPSGWDARTGYGAVDALAAAQYIAPSRFGVPQPKPRNEHRRRTVGR